MFENFTAKLTAEETVQLALRMQILVIETFDLPSDTPNYEIVSLAELHRRIQKNPLLLLKLGQGELEFSPIAPLAFQSKQGEVFMQIDSEDVDEEVCYKSAQNTLNCKKYKWSELLMSNDYHPIYEVEELADVAIEALSKQPITIIAQLITKNESGK